MQLWLPEGLANPLGKRMLALMFVRLLVLALLLGIIAAYYLREVVLGDFSSTFLVGTVAVAFLLSAVFLVWMRSGKHLEPLAHAQLVLDQLTWTAMVYLSGGVTSGSSSLYGLSCLSGVILLGSAGALSSALAGMLSYLALSLAFAYGVVLPPPDQSTSAYVVDGQAMVYPVFSTLMATGLVAMLAIYLAERLRTTGGRLIEATQRAEDAERLAALGRLAAGLAHEIRNPLGSIRGSIELLRTGGTLDADDVTLCRIIEREATRLNDLVTDMMDLSRPRAPQREPTDLAAIARSVTELAGAASGGERSIRYLGPKRLMAQVDGGQMRQVLWNLVRNALQATTDKEEVCVVLEVKEKGAVLAVKDKGQGIAEDELERVFDAFYTTRSHGVGIGLAVVKKVMDSHQFPLEVISHKGAGTSFLMHIPHKALLSSTLLLTLLVTTAGCRGGSEWVSGGQGHDQHPWALDDWTAAAGGAAPATSARTGQTTTAAAGGAAPATSARTGQTTTAAAAKPAAAASAATIALTGQAPRTDHPGDDLRLFRNTYYDFPEESAFDAGAGARVLFDASCKTIATVRLGFHDQLCVQGSGKLLSGATVSFAKRDCACAHVCPRTDQHICFEKLDQKRFPHGRGALGTAITPLRTVAVDVDVVPLNAVLYIPAYHGLRDSKGTPHDGCFIAQDRGLKVKGRHVDIFTGSPANTKRWNDAVPSNTGVLVHLGAARCRYLSAG